MSVGIIANITDPNFVIKHNTIVNNIKKLEFKNFTNIKKTIKVRYYNQDELGFIETDTQKIFTVSNIEGNIKECKVLNNDNSVILYYYDTGDEWIILRIDLINNMACLKFISNRNNQNSLLYCTYIIFTEHYVRQQHYLPMISTYEVKFDILITDENIHVFKNDSATLINCGFTMPINKAAKLLKLIPFTHNHRFAYVDYIAPSICEIYEHLSTFSDDEHALQKLYHKHIVNNDLNEDIMINLIIEEKQIENKKKLEMMKLGFNCKICLMDPVSYMYSKCKHLCICEKCKDKTKNKCPICRQDSDTVKVFI